MAVDSKRGLSECMALLKNADPRVADKFLRHLEAYVTDLTIAVTDAPPDCILVAQGRAQQARKFLLLFTELVRDGNAPSP